MARCSEFIAHTENYSTFSARYITNISSKIIIRQSVMSATAYPNDTFCVRMQKCMAESGRFKICVSKY
jgi:hypothetical protein